MNRKTRQFVQISAIFFILIIVLLSLVSATKASTGSGRMVLRMNVSDSLEKYVLVLNGNPFPVRINITSSGDLAKYVVIKDKIFTLNAEEEEKVFFTIKAAKSGITETQLNILFTPINPKDGSAIGISAAVVVIASGSDAGLEPEEEEDEINSQDTENNSNDEVDSNEDGEDEKDSEESDLENNVVINFAEDTKENPDTRDKITTRASSSVEKKTITIPKMLILSTIALAALLILLIFYSKKYRKKKRLKGGHG